MSFLGKALKRFADRRREYRDDIERQIWLNEYVRTLPSEEEQKETLLAIAASAQHLMDVLGLMHRAGEAVFKIDEDAHDPLSVCMLRHAVLDLQANLDGTVPPVLALPDPKELN